MGEGRIARRNVERLSPYSSREANHWRGQRQSESESERERESERVICVRTRNGWNSGSRSLGKILGAICIRSERGPMRQKEEEGRGYASESFESRGEMCGEWPRTGRAVCFPPLCGEGARYTVSEDCFLLSELGVTIAAPTVARLSRMWRDKRRTICQGQMIAKGTMYICWRYEGEVFRCCSFLYWRLERCSNCKCNIIRICKFRSGMIIN